MLDVNNSDTPSERIAALRRSGLLTRSAEDEFGHLTTHVQDVLNVPVAIVSLVDEDRQVFAGHSGLPQPWAGRGETPMTHSFCQHVVDKSAPLVVTDARLDPLLRDNLAIADLDVVAYLGVPIALPDREIAGALAAIDSQPRVWTVADMRRLTSIARTVEKEMAVRISEARWRSTFENMSEGFYVARSVCDDKGDLTDLIVEDANPSLAQIVGLSIEEIMGLHLAGRTERAFRGIMPVAETVLRSGERSAFETRPDGVGGRLFESRVRRIDDVRIAVTVIEVTEQREAQAATRQAEARYRTLIDNVDVGVCLIDLKFDADGRAVDYRITDANAAYERHTGLVNSIGKWTSEFAPDLERHWFDTYGEVAKTGRSIQFENGAAALGNRWFEVEAHRVGEAEAAQVAILFTDVTSRRQATIELSESERKWRGLFESLQEGFLLGEVIRDADGRIVDWRYEEVNRAWGELLGLSPDDVVGRTVREVIPDVEDVWVNEFAEVVETGAAIRFTRRVGTLDRWYDGVAQSVGGDRFTVIFMEVTDRIKRDRRQASLLTLGDELRGRSNLETIVTAAARCVADGLEVDRVGSGLVDLHDEMVIVRTEWCEAGIQSVIGRHPFASFGTYFADLQRGEVVAIDDIRSDPRTSGQVAAFDAIQTRSLLNLPIGFDGHLDAIVFANSQTVHSWTDGELQFIQQVGDRVRAALARQRMEDSQRVLTQEMAHRMKNLLSMVQAITAQTLRQASSVDEAREAVFTRISALARAQDILVRSNFEQADAGEIVEAAVAPHQTADHRIGASGPRFGLTAQQALGLSLAIHELSTNAAKYGALSNETGRVAMSWRVADDAFEFSWIETSGPLVVPPQRRGFGSKLIERIVASYFDGQGRIDFDPAGIRFKLVGAPMRPAHAA